MPTISACLIVKNEETNIIRCLKSIKDKVDEIVIVDTGSTDSTKHFAKRFTDKIFNFKWDEEDGLGNFARARNYSISKAKGDYVFWIDADEELFDLTGNFRELVSKGHESILFRQAQCVPKEDHVWNEDQMHDRLFKRGDIKFTGVIHEYPSKDDLNYLPNSVFQEECYILHYGLANMRLKADKSILRNGPLIEKNLKLNPNNPVAHYYLLTLYWSKYAFDLDNKQLQIDAFSLWDTYFKTQGTWIQKMSADILMRFMKVDPAAYIAYENYYGRTAEEAKYIASLLG